MAGRQQRDTSATGEKRARVTPAKPRSGRRSGETLSAQEVADAKIAFLDAYAQHGNMGAACEAARVHRSSVYRWLEHDEPFSLLYTQAKAEYDDLVREEIDRRARRGWSETVYQLGKRAGAVRKYSDTLLIFHAKARMPEYRDKVDVSAQIQGSVSHDINLATDSEAANLANAFLRRLTALGSGESSGSSVSSE